MVEGGDLLLSAPVMEMLKDVLTTPFSEDSTELPARDDVPDLHSPPSRTFTHQDVTPGVQSPSSGDITPPLPEQEAGDQPSPQHIWTVEDDKPADFYAMD